MNNEIEQNSKENLNQQEKLPTMQELMNDKYNDPIYGLINRIQKNKVLAKLLCWLDANTRMNDDKPFSVKGDVKPHFRNYTSDYLRKLLSELDEKGGYGIVKKVSESGNHTSWAITKERDGTPKFKKFISYAVKSYRQGDWTK